MKHIALIFALLATGCNLDIEHEVPDIPEIEVVVRVCIDDWLYDTHGNPLLDEFGAQLICQVD